MVEGPGTTRNGRKASSLLTKTVRNLQIGSVSGSTRNTSSSPEWWRNRQLSQVITIGKELFLIFSIVNDDCSQCGAIQSGEDNANDKDMALRVHFGMNGALHVNKPTTQPRPSDPVTLEITFDSNILRTYQTNSVSQKPIPAIAPRRKYLRLHTHDVCSPTFSVKDVLDQLDSILSSLSGKSSLPSTIISDVLLNQNILPGIGNVIKIEGLHEARVHPKRQLESFSREELSYLITCCREYSIKWLNNGRAPAKYVYNQTICGSCYEPSVAICRLGGTDRTTFWCTRCQRIDSNGIFKSSTSTDTCGVNSSSQEPIVDSNLTSLPTMACKVCPTHGPRSILLRRCKKKSVNEQRIFYTCQARGCNFFCWADLRFPKCKCGKRVVMRVSKTEKSGGRWFFFCGKRLLSNNGCGHFQWVDRETLERFGHLLTPLL